MNKTIDVLVLIVYVALVFVLVRPGSQGPSLISNIGNSLSGLLQAATGGGTWSGK